MWLSYRRSASPSKTSHVSFPATLGLGCFCSILCQKLTSGCGFLARYRICLWFSKGAHLFSKSAWKKVIVPNLSYLEQQRGLSLCQIVQLIKFRPRFITSRTEALKMIAKRAEELGVARSSQMFVYALVVVGSMNKDIIDARLNNFKNLGFSQEEVTTLVSTHPMVLNITEENIGSKIQFLIMDAGCHKLHVVRNPVLLTLSLVKRLIPRSLVLKLLESKGLPVAKRGLLYFSKQNEKIVIPYEHTILGLHQAYTDIVSGKTPAKEWFKNISI